MCTSPLFYSLDASWVANVVSLCFHLPPNIYILQLILSRNLITAEFFPLNMAISEIFINLNSVLRVATVFFEFNSIFQAEIFFLGFILTSRPLLLMVICVERYLAVAKPLFFMRFKHFKYKLPVTVLIWLLTLLSGLGIVLLSQTFYFIVTAQMIAVCVIKLHCCVATLYILKKPGPGEKVDSRNGMNNVKLKAFRIIFILTVSVIVTYFPLICILLLANYFSKSMLITIQTLCYVCTATSGFVQSLLFLHRYERLPSIKCIKSL